MASEILENIKQQTASLTFSEKAELAAFLQEQSSQNQTPPNVMVDVALAEKEILHRKRTAWLREHGEEYQGVYIALDDDCKVVGQGRTIRDANGQAKQKGSRHPFLVRIPRENEAFCPGW